MSLFHQEQNHKQLISERLDNILKKYDRYDDFIISAGTDIFKFQNKKEVK